MEAYVGEIRMFAGDFAPQNWLKCDGSLQSVSTYQTLFSLIGTTYGGDGATTFGLPDFRGRIPVGQGQGTGLSLYTIGQKGGAETVTLDANAMPGHVHTVNAATQPAASTTPSNTVVLAATTAPTANYINPASTTPTARVLDASTVGAAGGLSPTATYPHGNIMPSFAVTFIICTYGLYPDRQ